MWKGEKRADQNVISHFDFLEKRTYVVVLILGRYSALQCTEIEMSAFFFFPITETSRAGSLEIPVAAFNTYKGNAWMKRSLRNETLH